jgi:hypothetical protein
VGAGALAGTCVCEVTSRALCDSGPGSRTSWSASHRRTLHRERRAASPHTLLGHALLRRRTSLLETSGPSFSSHSSFRSNQVRLGLPP